MKSIITEYINEDKRYQELNEVFGKENVLVTGLSGATTCCYKQSLSSR